METNLSPLDYPHMGDRITRMLIAVLVNSGTPVSDAIKQVIAGRRMESEMNDRMKNSYGGWL